MHRLGWSWQAPSRRAAERDEQAIGGEGSLHEFSLARVCPVNGSISARLRPFAARLET
ncbi:winged helix-turn-helix domain-containing protein [Nonomuraea mangrovi]|uniref:Winged helix-turn-helix domain-containing protein n=1 Tax=Nonomuraea mangrovi TaxID=2316207 RepID=A0ABW4T6U8_9ACTN